MKKKDAISEIFKLLFTLFIIILLTENISKGLNEWYFAMMIRLIGISFGVLLIWQFFRDCKIIKKKGEKGNGTKRDIGRKKRVKKNSIDSN